MMQPLYIQAATAISPQQTFDRQHFLQPVLSSNNGKLFVTEPDFRAYINPVAIRRMSRLMKMAISAAIQCLKDADVASPDAIITGTGRGSMTDTEHFLNDMIRLNEGPMNPTSFIQSTYNSPNGWIAMQVKSTAYNQTFVHRGCSLELAMLDTQLLFAEAADEVKYSLAGCYDELTDEYFLVKDKVGYWKYPLPESSDLLQQNDTPGTIGGEGAAFFTFSNRAGMARSVIRHMEIIQQASGTLLEETVQKVLKAAGLHAQDIDLVLTGQNGDQRQESLYNNTLSRFPGQAVAGFKHLCGEYDTSNGFGIWLADWLIREQTLPEILCLKKGEISSIRYILLVNHYILGSASILLIAAV